MKGKKGFQKGHRSHNSVSVVYNGIVYRSIKKLSESIGVPASTIHDKLRRDEEINGHYIDIMI